jgi:hypothetical protein
MRNEVKPQLVAESNKKEGRSLQITDDDHDSILKLQQNLLLSSLQAQEAEIVFRRAVAELCQRYNMPIERSALCLSCGLIRDAKETQCPNCL